MREGAQRVDWTTDEIAYLVDAAGGMPLREICRELKRSTASVKHMAGRLGVSLRCYKRKLVWCTECASWRTYVNARTGRCKVCQQRENLQGREAACAEVMAIMTPEQRTAYEETESQRQTRAIPRRPKMQAYCVVSRYQRDRAHEQYLREIETWEYRCLVLQYDAVKTRLKRMREKTGTNPRKNKETNGTLINQA